MHLCDHGENMVPTSLEEEKLLADPEHLYWAVGGK